MVGSFVATPQGKAQQTVGATPCAFEVRALIWRQLVRAQAGAEFAFGLRGHIEWSLALFRGIRPLQKQQTQNAHRIGICAVTWLEPPDRL